MRQKIEFDLTQTGQPSELTLPQARDAAAAAGEENSGATRANYIPMNQRDAKRAFGGF